MSTPKIVWNYLERVGTGYVILIIGGIGGTLGEIFNNYPALALGIFCIQFGAHRIGYAHGMRDMHCLDTGIPAGQRLKDFSLYAEKDEDDGH